MRHRPASLIAMTALVLAMVAWLPGAAVGAEDSYRASGEASGFAVNIPEVTEIATGRSEADISSDLLAHGRGVGILIADGSISEVTVEQPGVTERDPAEGQNCAFPDLPGPLDLVDAACSFALGSTTDSLPRGLGDATGLELELTGADVVALVDFLLGHIDETELGEAIDSVEAQVIEPVKIALAEACLEALTPLVEEFGDDADALITAIEEGFESDLITIEDLQEEDTCALLIEYIFDPPVLVDEDGDGQAGADDLITVLRDTLAGELKNVSLLDILLGGSVSEGVATSAAATGSSNATGVDIALPSLNLLGNTLGVLTTLVEDFLKEVQTDLSTIAEVNYDQLPIPEPGALIAELRAAIPQELQDVLADDDPLLRITGGQSVATAVYDRAAGEVTTEGQVKPLVLDLADSLATLLGVSDEDPFTVPEGDSVTIAEGTPLETTANLATCTAEEATQDGLEGERISCAGLELVLLKGLVGDDPETDEMDGGISAAGAKAEAAAFGEPAPAPAPEPEEPAAAPPSLPTTGGGLALLGLIAVGSALALRRRS